MQRDALKRRRLKCLYVVTLATVSYRRATSLLEANERVLGIRTYALEKDARNEHYDGYRHRTYRRERRIFELL